jgi:hypothetical protein
MPTITTVMPRITQRSHQYFPYAHPSAPGVAGRRV